MIPVSPVIAGMEAFELTVGVNQPEYLPLPVLIGRAPTVSFISRWHLSDEERKQIAAGADIFSIQHTFGGSFQPLLLVPATVEQNHAEVMEHFGIGEILPADLLRDSLDKC